MKPSILSIAKAKIPYSLTQEEVYERILKHTDLSDEKKNKLKKIYEGSCIERRFSILPDLLLKNSPIGMSERNAHYKREAPLLAESTSIDTLNAWRGSYQDITHVISTSCTGVITPGLEMIVARKLNLNPRTHLLGINMMGCFGAFKGLKVATKIAKDNPKNRVLLISTETCSIHIKPQKDFEAMVIHSLFGDGCAACVIGMEPRGDEKSLFEIIDEYTYCLPDTYDDITWDASDLGFDMKLSLRVPKLIAQNIATFIREFLGTTSPYHSYEWAIHPGGKAIIDAVEQTLKISKDLTLSTWNVLKNFGNLSSATFLYVLEDIYQRKIENKKIVGIGFGPGVAIEGLLLECGKAAH